MSKYYYREHALGYRRIAAEGKTAWNEIHGSSGFENFSSRAFLERVLPRLRFPTHPPAALEYGCGTGPGACFLAERGIRVDAIDLIPTAIEIAVEQARVRGLDIRYRVQDICELPRAGRAYDLIVDSYCLQGIVTDADRQKVFSVVAARLRPKGYYVVSSAMFDEGRLDATARLLDAETGIVYHPYGDRDGLIDLKTGIVYEPMEADLQPHDDTRYVKGRPYLPNRRHHTGPALKAEIEAAGFRVLVQDKAYGGNLVCVRRGSSQTLRAGQGRPPE
jgi:SAM-dependent methyltransferase